MLIKNPQERYGRYIQTEENLTLYEVIERGITDLKERLADSTRPTVTRIFNAQKHALEASPSTRCIQLVNRTTIFGLQGRRANKDELQAAIHQQGLNLHICETNRVTLSGAGDPSGCMSYPTKAAAKDGRLSPLIFTGAAAASSKTFDVNIPDNMVQTLPARLEPLFAAFVSYHEEGHALDDLIDAHENHNESSQHIFSKQVAQIAYVSDYIKSKNPGSGFMMQVPPMHKAWLKSLNETKQDVYGLLQAVNVAEREGYTEEDMLALVDFIHDQRAAKSSHEYITTTGISAVRYQIEQHGFAAPERIANLWGNPSQEESHANPDNALHTAVRQWVKGRELYMDAASFAGWHYYEDWEELPEELLPPETIEPIKKLKEEQNQAINRLKRPHLAEHVSLTDATSLNAVIARQFAPEHQALELRALTYMTEGHIGMHGLNNEGSSPLAQYHESQHDYLRAVAEHMPELEGALDQLPQRAPAPDGIACFAEDKNNEEHVLTLSKVENGFMLRAQNYPHTDTSEAKLSQRASEHNITLVLDDVDEPFIAMLESLDHYGELTIRSEKEADLGLKTNLFKEQAYRDVYKCVHEMFDGKIHPHDALERVDDIIFDQTREPFLTEDSPLPEEQDYSR